MDYTRAQQDDLKRRENRRASKKKQSDKKPTTLRAQLRQAINSRKLRRETPQEMADRLWRECNVLLIKANNNTTDAAKREYYLKEASSKATRVVALVESRGCTHPGTK